MPSAFCDWTGMPRKSAQDFWCCLACAASNGVSARGGPDGRGVPNPGFGVENKPGAELTCAPGVDGNAADGVGGAAGGGTAPGVKIELPAGAAANGFGGGGVAMFMTFDGGSANLFSAGWAGGCCGLIGAVTDGAAFGASATCGVASGSLLPPSIAPTATARTTITAAPAPIRISGFDFLAGAAGRRERTPAESPTAEFAETVAASRPAFVELRDGVKRASVESVRIAGRETLTASPLMVGAIAAGSAIAVGTCIAVDTAVAIAACGVLNSATISAIVGRSRRDGTELSLVLLDIDHFKSINDRYGHRRGDEALRAVAQEMRRSVRSYDSVGRYGGEEFLLVLPGCNEFNAAGHAERFRAALEQVRLAPPHEDLRISASFGVVAIRNEAFAGPEAWIEAADTALYQAKRLGRNRVVIGTLREQLLRRAASPT